MGVGSGDGGWVVLNFQSDNFHNDVEYANFTYSLKNDKMSV